MKTMNLGRALVAVLLVCALLFSWSPVKAEATSGGAAAGIVAAPIPVSAKIVIAGVVIALGVYLGTNPDAFNQIVEGIQAVGEAAGWVVDGMIDVYKSGDLTYIDADLPQSAKDFLWSEGYLSDGSEIPSNAHSTISSSITNFVNQGWASIHLILTTDYGYCLIASQYSSFVFQSSGADTIDDSEFYCKWGAQGGSMTTSVGFGLNYVIVGSYGANDEKDISTSYDLSLGDVASSTQDLASGYPAWYGTSLPIAPSGADSVVIGIPVTIPATYEEAITQTQTEAQSGTTSITDTDVAVGTLDGTLAETEAKTFVEVIAGYFNNVVTAIQAIPDAIVTGITDALTSVFVPSEDYLTAKVDAIRAEFAFADSIISSGESIKGYLDSIGPEPPVIYINLDDFEGGYDIGGQVAFLDLRWYERYKPTGDAIISAFLWLVFAWRVFIHLPGLISGARGVVGFSISSANETGLSSSETGLRRYD